MKVKTAVTAGLLITCTAVLHAQDTRKVQEGKISLVRERPMIFKEMGGTNDLLFLALGDSVYSYGESNVWVEIEEASPREKNNPPVIILPRNAEALEVEDKEQTAIQPTTSNPSLFDTVSGNKILFWRKDATNTNEGALSRNDIQIIEFEPKDGAVYIIKIPEYRFDSIQPRIAWHEWMNPRLFLAKWVEYWNTETNATPVVLVKFSF
jgi:hypothetical protein